MDNFETATLASVIKHGIDSRLKDLHTSLPGIIESFDAATQLAFIQPAIKRIFKTDEGDVEILTPTELPILINVPVQFPRGGGFSLTFPVQKGDECLLVFCERSIDNWHQTGGVQKPGAKRFHSLSDATAFVGISSLSNKVPNYDDTNVQLKKDDDSVYITCRADGSMKSHSNADMDLDTGADINIIATVDLNATIGGDVNINATGDIIADAGGSASITSVGNTDVTAPIINLNGIVNISGLCSMGAGMAVIGTALSNGVNIGSTHVHPQGNDTNGDAQVNVGVPQ